MKKKFNLLGWIFVLIYILIVILIIFLGKILSQPIKDYLYFGVFVFLICFIWLIPLTYLNTLRFILPLKKGHSVVLSKPIQYQKWWMNTYSTYIPILFVNFLLDDGTRKSCRMTAKKYRLLSSGDRGNLYYKEQGRRTFFIDFKKL